MGWRGSIVLIYAEGDIAKNSEDILEHVDGEYHWLDLVCIRIYYFFLGALVAVTSEQEPECIVGVFNTGRTHARRLEAFREDHAGQAASIEQKAFETFQEYRDYEPNGSTPVRCEHDVPTKGTIESLRTLPMEALLEEFRENHPYESSDVKELKPSLIPRSPLSQLN
ncbi:hypothetical protein RJT34_19594 [Clitoria ternatea]|uniref:Uncharacterized protein n=1 Tax=Clitoria ternatea TaxID=43366 RepID=A0AAN9P4M9_CLITE